MGFRHGHVMDILRRTTDMPELELAAVCEEDPATREELTAAKSISFDFADYSKMLDSVDCDAIAVGDYYGKRGQIIIEALNRGKHVISDKPICTDLTELETITQLARGNGRVVSAMLDMRDAAPAVAMRELIRGGSIGEIHAIFFGGQHPLNPDTRPSWYFEPGKHGGTINDIAVHAFDFIPWMTGLQFATVNAARNWNAVVADYPHFKDAAQVMLTMSNGCGVLGDVSYLMPSSYGYDHPCYWRVTVWGRDGVIETSEGARMLHISINGETEVRRQPLPEGRPGGYLRAFVDEVNGRRDAGSELCSADVLRASRQALIAQKAADQSLTNVEI